MPLYAQLRDRIKYSISTGAIRPDERLPGLVDLAKTLEVNFETVRKAYKELEREGLIHVRRGKGAFARFAAAEPAAAAAAPANRLRARARALIGEFVEAGTSVEDARAIVEEAFHDVETGRLVIFTECNAFQVQEISSLLARELRVSVKGVMLDDLLGEVKRALDCARSPVVITTGFHVNAVRATLGSLPAPVDFVLTNTSPDTLGRIRALDRSARVAFICRDASWLDLYRGVLKAELGLHALFCCTLAESEKVEAVVRTFDAVLVSPPVYEAVRRIARPGMLVLNLLDQVDPASVTAIRRRMTGRA
jgi:GntR family transcriptional regulator